MMGRIMRICQKPPYAYIIGSIAFIVYTILCATAATVIVGMVGLTFLMGGWWLIERGSTHQKRVEARKRRLRELEQIDN